MREHFVLDYGRVLVEKYVLNGESRDLREEDAAEGVCNGGVEADEGEGGVVGGGYFWVGELDVEILYNMLAIFTGL